MGDYTSTQKYYLIDPEEFVAVDQDLNYNLRRADSRIKALVEYQVTAEASIVLSTNLEKDTGFKWYKSYTNSIWNYRNNTLSQDVNCQIDTWSPNGITFETGYNSVDQGVDRVAYSSFNNFVRWRGRVRLNSGDALPTNTTVDFMTVPTSILPVRAKYFTVYGGNSTGTEFQCFRIFVPASNAGDKRIEFCKYGGNGSANDENYISLNDVFYALDDTDPAP